MVQADPACHRGEDLHPQQRAGAQETEGVVEEDRVEMPRDEAADETGR